MSSGALLRGPDVIKSEVLIPQLLPPMLVEMRVRVTPRFPQIASLPLSFTFHAPVTSEKGGEFNEEDVRLKFRALEERSAFTSAGNWKFLRFRTNSVSSIWPVKSRDSPSKLRARNPSLIGHYRAPGGRGLLLLCSSVVLEPRAKIGFLL